jgi:hypothetical protein
MTAELADLPRFLDLLTVPGEVREVRIPKWDGRNTASGYFDDPARMVDAVAEWDGRANVYLTLNPVAPALLARAANRIEDKARSTTGDADIVERRWVLVDVDPVRPAGISASEAERMAAQDTARAIRLYLHQLAWAEPIVVMTGNGYALLYPVKLPNDGASLGLVEGVLAHLAERFDSSAVTIDRSVANAARIGCLVGTKKVKGDPLPDRPHRRSSLIAEPETLEPVPVELLRALVPATNGHHVAPGDDRMPAGWVREWLDRTGVAYRVGQRKGVTWYLLVDCPFHPGEDVGGDCGVAETPDGMALGKCFHNRGSGKQWREFREALGLEPPPPIRILGPQRPASPSSTTQADHPSSSTTIGIRTACDLRYGPRPDPLASPFLTPEGATCLFGRGGVGKGVVACYLIGRLVAAGHVVMVVDYEGHEREWGSRLRGFGLTEDELAKVHYRAPFGSDWTAPTGALSAVASLLREDAARVGATYVVVDSYTVATSNGDTMGGEAAAREYFAALTIIGLPSLTIAHVRGDSPRFPDRPFGSVFVHNLARETWAVERLGDEPDTDPDLLRVGPHVVELELRNRKANGGPKLAPEFLTFSFYADGTIEATDRRPSGRAIADLAADALADGPLTVPKIVAAIREDTGERVDEDTLGRTLRRSSGRFVADKSKRPHQWSIR